MPKSASIERAAKAVENLTPEQIVDIAANGVVIEQVAALVADLLKMPVFKGPALQRLWRPRREVITTLAVFTPGASTCRESPPARSVGRQYLVATPSKKKPSTAG